MHLQTEYQFFQDKMSTKIPENSTLRIVISRIAKGSSTERRQRILERNFIHLK